MRLRVLTANVQNGEGDLRRTSLVNQELRRLEPDLVAGDGPGYTWSVDNSRAAAEIGQVVWQPWLSDHSGVLVDLEVNAVGR